MESIKKILRTPSAFMLLLAAIISLLGIIIKSKSDENIARIPIDATSTAEARLTQLANTTIPAQTTMITETVTPTNLQISATQTAEAYPAILLTQSADNPDLNPNLLKFSIISIQDSAVNRDGFPYGWETPDPVFQDLSMFRAAGSAEKFWSRNGKVIDPPFDIVILNTASEPIFVTHIGIELVKVSNVIRGGGGGFPFSEKVEIQDEYEIILPDINAMQEGAGLFEYGDLNLNQVVSIKLSNPIYMQSQAPYCFILTLRDGIGA